MDWLHELKKNWKIRVHEYAGMKSEVLPIQKPEGSERKLRLLENRGAEIVKAKTTGEIYSLLRYEKNEIVQYALHHEYLLKQKEHIYIEEEIEHREAEFKNGKLKSDRVLIERQTGEPPVMDWDGRDNEERAPFYYDRLAAVKYAERWWNSYNPNFKKFDVDCTNFISQCLFAGGAPMTGYPSRNKGWWHRNNNWSYSWSVAHALRWYLSGAKAGLRGKEMASADLLQPGDVICYDFEGDGKWDHNTIVVAKDAVGMPLVNAHTNNSRMRYWSYEDSAAWTPNIQYKFFHIADDN